MHPVLFDLHLGRLGSFTVGTYGLFYALGFLLALRLAMGYARREGIETSRIVDLGIVTLLAGFIGAKSLLYVLDARYYLEHPMEMLKSLRSAGVFYGGFVLATLAALLYVRERGECREDEATVEHAGRSQALQHLHRVFQVVARVEHVKQGLGPDETGQ